MLYTKAQGAQKLDKPLSLERDLSRSSEVPLLFPVLGLCGGSNGTQSCVLDPKYTDQLFCTSWPKDGHASRKMEEMLTFLWSIGPEAVCRGWSWRHRWVIVLAHGLWIWISSSSKKRNLTQRGWEPLVCHKPLCMAFWYRRIFWRIKKNNNSNQIMVNQSVVAKSFGATITFAGHLAYAWR